MIRSFLIPIFAATTLLAIPVALRAQVHNACTACHSGQTGDFKKHKHFAGGISCDACHGVSQQHQESQGMVAPEKTSGPADQPALCGACHAEQAKSYSASEHGKLVAARSEKRGATCTMCHGNHALRAFPAMEQQCARCHESLPASCKENPPSSDARIRCANCHDKHTLAVKK
jgi:hypothetical protein